MKSLRILLLFALVVVFFSASAQSETGKFSPAAKEPGESKILLVDDDMELQLSGPYLEATHIVTALNDGGYSYDIFRTGQFDGDNYELPSGAAGLSMVDNYEVVIWYSGWNTNILSSSEVGVMEHYLDGDCGEADNFCAQTRNIILLTQMIDWVDWAQSSFLNTYLHADTDVSSYLVVDGTSNPMDGVSDSIFDSKDYATDTAGTYYMDRPCGIKHYDSTATGAFWMDSRKGAVDGHEYHAVQFPVDDYVGNQNHKAFTFANEIGVFNERSERADFFATILDWMEVEEETTQDNDLGISSLEIPRHHAHGEIEKYVPIEIKVGVTNYGNETVGSVNVRLKIKTEEGLVFYDNTLDTRAFPEGHPIHIEEVLEPGETIIFTFNKTNDRHQRIYEGESYYSAIHTMMRLSGLNTLDIEVGGSDANPSNNKIITKIFSAVYVHTFEPDDAGYSYYLGDTDDNGVSSYEGVNWHLVDSYDWDTDGCGWASEVPENCEDDEGTLNHTGLYVAKNGDYAIASFNQNAWYKDNANSDECDWGDMSDPDCPKFVPNPNQDDYVMFGPFDFSGMNEVVVNYFYSGCLESGDYHNLQISKDGGYSWSNIYSESGLCANLGAWYMHQGENTKYVGLELDSEWYGTDDTDSVYIRIQMDTDDDQITESSDQPYSGLFIDDFIIRGTEKLTRDVAVGDISVREGDDMIVKDSEGNSLWREINATVINAGEASWTDLPVKFSVTNSQGDDMSDYLDYSEPSISGLSGESRYGDITAEGAEDQKELFVLFQTPYSDAYYVTVEVLVPAGKDFFPSNNSRTVKVCIFSDGDDEDDDCVGNSYDECPDTPDSEEVDDYGCSYSQRDNDSDGIINGADNCPDTLAGEEVDDHGCSYLQRDNDSDGVINGADNCPDTSYFNVTINGTIHLSNETDMNGCSPYQLDDDNDGVMNDKDECPDTLPLSSDEYVTEFGCLEEADNSVVSCSSTSFMNNIYTQSGSSESLIGKASYHFVSEDNVYVNWESFGTGGVRFDNGQLVFTKTFTETTFDYESRTFYGTIDFSDPEGTTLSGASSYVYQMVFSEDYTTISSGYYSIYSEENLLGSYSFGEGGLKYYLLCDILATDYTPAEVDSTSDNTYEGDDPGECSDGADNDQDGQFDCDDAACKGSPDCKAGAGTDIEEIESGGLPSISLIPVIGLLVLITIIRRRF